MFSTEWGYYKETGKKLTTLSSVYYKGGCIAARSMFKSVLST